MDDLVHHILRELSFDGDLGCSISRLEDFIKEFYQKNVAQTVDEAYCAFVWSVILQESTVRVGVLPPGEHTEVYVAPQRSAQRKAKKGEDVTEEPAAALTIVLDAAIRGLDELRREYGDTLRIAVDPAISFAAITGSHIRPSKLTPMVYTALQLITRGREKGISVVELGRKTRYDQKTCFYLVKQLETLNLVIKIRQAGVGTHFCMHKHFYERSVFWKSVREEATIEKFDPQDDDGNGEESQPSSSRAPQFDPIDSRHLSSLPLLRGRIIKLLNNSTNHMHASQNLLITLGFEHPTKTDRRFFTVRLAELVKEGTIEKVLVPNSNTKRYPNGKVQCIRLVNMDDNVKRDQEKEGIVVLPTETDEGEDESDDGDVAGPKETFRLKANIVIHRQIIDLLVNADSRGMTLSENSQQLCNFDRRTVELLLQRLERDPPPPHLLDLGIAVVTETHGRERRHRYYTYKAYRSLLEKENLDDADGTYSSVDLSNVGSFFAVGPEQFYDSEEQLLEYQDAFRDQENKQKGKKHKTTNPILDDGTVKKGRPRKDQPPQTAKRTSSAAGVRKSKRKQVGEEEEDDDVENPPLKKGRKTEDSINLRPGMDETQYTPKRRGRPPKNPADRIQEESPLKKRGRPPKRQQENDSINQEQNIVYNPADEINHNLSGLPLTSSREELRDVSSPRLLPGSQTSNDIPARFNRLVVRVRSTSPSCPPDPAVAASRSSFSQVVEEQSTTTPTIHVPTSEPASQEQGDLFPDPTTTTSLNASGKRLRDETPTSPLSAKRLKSSKAGPQKTNVSHLRRDNELFRVIQEFGGITVVNVKEFLDAHINLIETLTNTGEPTSAPIGTRLDRRTVDAAMRKLESDCRIKVIKTSMFTTTGISRPVTIAHVFDMEQQKINSFVSDLSKNGPFGYVPSKVRRLSPGIEYESRSVIRPSATVSPLKVLQSDQLGNGDNERWGKNISRASQLFAYDDATIKDILQRESTTISQSYGYTIGKVARACKLHLLILDHLQGGVNRTGIVSTDNRIIHITHLLRDISISAYCSLVPTPARIEELDRLLETEEGKQTPLRDLPIGIYSGLSIGAAKSNSRFLDLLEILRGLKLATPLQPSQSETPWTTCAENGIYPVAFDVVPFEWWSSTSSAAAPVYWKFDVNAPVHLWTLSETAPPFWKDVPVSSHESGVTYWDELHKACLDPRFAKDLGIPVDSITANVLEGSAIVGRSLRRETSWKTSYTLSWYQERYLRQFIDPTPLLDEDGGVVRIKRIAWVINAPEQVVQQFYVECRERLAKESEKARRRIKRKTEPVKTTMGKKSLAKKAAERKIQRQQDWDSLVARLHPGPVKKPLLSRLKRICDEYLRAASVRESQKWELDIADAIRETNLATSKVLPTSRLNLGTTPSIIPSHVPLTNVTTSERSVENLIAQQGPSQRLSEPVKRKKSKKTDDGMRDSSQKRRRCRFSWTRDYDELAKDVSVIIKARCRSGQRMEWAAAEQAFPSLPRNSVRQRVDRLTKEPGVESYLHRLEDRWYDLWTQHRGTVLLPDPEPSSVSNFDLVRHLKFLRAHIDKDSLRAGSSRSGLGSNIQLPSTVEQLLNSGDVTEKVPVAPSWDVVWSTATEEGREKQMFSQAFVVNDRRLFPSPIYEEDRLYVVEAAVKMVLGAPNELYDPDIGAALLRRLGEDAVSVTTASLLNRGVLSKLVRDPSKPKPGRTLKISETNLNAIGGCLSRETFQDASFFEELSMEAQPIEQEDWQEWPLLASDGDMAALVELVSENKLDFKIDTTQAQAARLAIEWNSKKADDDDIETGIQIRIRDLSWTDMWPDPERLSNEPPRDPVPEESQGGSVHGRTTANEPACCRQDSAGAVHCQACLDDEFTAFAHSLNGREMEVVNRLINSLNDAGPAGIPKGLILLRTNPPEGIDMFCIIERMSRRSIPLVFWAGYVSAVLVSAAHLQPWTVITSESPLTRIFPRRWMDINGVKMVDVWGAGLRAVIGVIIFRPGISQSELRWKLRSVYDRSEINDMLRYLEDEKFVVRRCDSHLQLVGYGILDDGEEMETSWFLGSRHWYHV